MPKDDPSNKNIKSIVIAHEGEVRITYHPNDPDALVVITIEKEPKREITQREIEEGYDDKLRFDEFRCSAAVALAEHHSTIKAVAEWFLPFIEKEANGDSISWPEFRDFYIERFGHDPVIHWLEGTAPRPGRKTFTVSRFKSFDSIMLWGIPGAILCIAGLGLLFGGWSNAYEMEDRLNDAIIFTSISAFLILFGSMLLAKATWRDTFVCNPKQETWRHERRFLFFKVLVKKGDLADLNRVIIVPETRTGYYKGRKRTYTTHCIYANGSGEDGALHFFLAESADPPRARVLGERYAKGIWVTLQDSVTSGKEVVREPEEIDLCVRQIRLGRGNPRPENPGEIPKNHPMLEIHERTPDRLHCTLKPRGPWWGDWAWLVAGVVFMGFAAIEMGPEGLVFAPILLIPAAICFILRRLRAELDISPRGMIITRRWLFLPYWKRFPVADIERIEKLEIKLDLLNFGSDRIRVLTDRKRSSFAGHLSAGTFSWLHKAVLYYLG